MTAPGEVAEPRERHLMVVSTAVVRHSWADRRRRPASRWPAAAVVVTPASPARHPATGIGRPARRRGNARPPVDGPAAGEQVAAIGPTTPLPTTPR